MQYDGVLAFLRNALEKCHLQSIVADPGMPVADNVDMGLRMLFGNFEGNETYYDYFPDIKPKTVYRVSDIFLCRYIFLELPLLKDKKVLIIGPYLYGDITVTQIMEKGEFFGMSPKNMKQLEYFYASIPVVRDEVQLFAMVNTFAEWVWGGSFESVDISIENSAAFIRGVQGNTIGEKGDLMNIQAMEKRYEYENDLIAAVARGNIHKAEQMMASFSSVAFEERVPNKLRNIKNYCIIMNTLLRKAAESGGVHPIYIDRVSSDFAKKIESLQSTGAVSELMTEILKSYCRLVRRHSLKNYSSPVQRAIIAIEHDLTDDLSLKAMAEINNVNPSYFSGLFKKETGCTLTDYVNERRVNYAIHLLKTTNLQIQTVAQHIGILDMHYFCRLFKKYTGKTPSEYRKSIRFL